MNCVLARGLLSRAWPPGAALQIAGLWPMKLLSMWTCDQCNEQHADHFSTCWKCAGMEAPPRSVGTAAAAGILPCARCNTAMEALGTRRLPGAGGGGVLGEIGELFAKSEPLEAFACPRCGSVEFFLERVGSQHRAETRVAPPAAVDSVAPLTTTVERKFQEACSLEEVGHVEVAAARYEELAACYPGTNFARDAEERLRRIRERFDF